MILGRRLPALGPRGEGWVALQLLLIVAVFVACRLTSGELSGAPGIALSLLGNVLLFGGLAVILIAAAQLASSFTVMPRPPEQATLITSGLYRAVRNPIYTGLIATMFGLSLTSASWVALVLSAVLAVVLDLKTRREDVYLRERFAEYPAYAARTRRFIPGIY